MRSIFLSILLFLSAVSPLCAAGSKIKILTTTEDLRSIAEYIGGDRVAADSLARGYQDPHYLEAKPSFMMKAKNADLFMRVGLELEIGYEELIIDGSRNARIRVGQPGHLDVSEGVNLLEVPTTTKIDRSMGDVHPMGNPHYWLDPENVKIMARNIANRLSELSPENAGYFQENLAAFDKKMDEKMIEWRSKLAPFKGRKIAIYHRSWPYFADRFGLVAACELEPKPGIPPSPGHLKEVIDIMKRDKINVILMEVFYDEKPAEFVAGQTGAKVIVVPNSVGGTKEAKDYFSLMDTVVDKLAEGLKG
ncbi:MAG: zinc ABC transporter substrate-binding protein [Candidatus Omnitrophica bacterium]|nr:zinc ABC transporter substrate-binding protein [Candidatus Omnitrophota bacterium]